MSKKKRLLTGVQPSGVLHIGNYFGAIKPFLDRCNDNESFLMIADYHALTSLRNPDDLRNNITDIVRSYLAIGIDPKKVTIFRQSDNQDHTELAWIFNCMVTVPFLMQAHAYKDKVARGIEANAGLFTYPMLQAADIALYNIDYVPVGEDQRQHLEYTREAIKKFNTAYGQIFNEPKEIILKEQGIVPGIDGQKMSKSYGNTIPLFGTHCELEKAVMSIITDSEGNHPEHVYAIHKFFRNEDALLSLYKEHSGKYGELKRLLLEDIESFVTPLREARLRIKDNEVEEVLKSGIQKARKISNETLAKVRSAIGLN